MSSTAGSIGWIVRLDDVKYPNKPKLSKYLDATIGSFMWEYSWDYLFEGGVNGT